MSARWDIRICDDSPVSEFAAREFARLVGTMDPSAAVSVKRERYDTGTAALWVGRDAALPSPPSTADPARDDAIRIDVSDCAGYITGVNERSVLLAVYRFFREAGCAFVRPGRDGEYIPRLSSAALRVSVCEAAAYRHRAICIEGAVSYENVAGIIDWAPKAGFNGYFTQFFTPFEFFDRWYSHRSNPAMTPTPVSADTVDRFLRDYGAEIKKRGMMHHGVGHGWTARVLGVGTGGWYQDRDEDVAPDRRELMAEVNGKRGLWRGVAINTNLCYSNPRARELMVREIVDYAQAHRDVDYIHCWLADAANNHCECERCRDTLPADFYVEMLNEADARLTALGLPTRIVFLIYLELLWPPERARFTNPDRFTLMFAPISRTYSEPMHPDARGEMAPFVRNDITHPRAVGDAMAYLRAWQRVFDGDSFVFDYHYMWDHFMDPGYYEMARVLGQDIENLRALGLNGYVSCQNQRVFLPSGLGMHIMGHTLWSGSLDFEGEAARYFDAACGRDGALCRAYLAGLSRLFDSKALRGEKPIKGAESARRYREIPAYIDEFLPVIERNREEGPLCHRRTWEYLSLHAQLCRGLAAVLAARAEGDDRAADDAWAEVRDWACRNEQRMQPVFDVFEFISTWERRILRRPAKA
ncbi:MAG: DUF4838 domain-containing protein [Christensenellales bacterium]|jgi:hypothetical protein